MSSEHVPAGSESRQSREVRVRRAPKFGPFMGAGVVLGIILAAVSAYTGPENAEFTRNSVFGFLAVVFGAIGMFLAALIVLVVDRISVRRSRKMLAVETAEEGSDDAEADRDGRRDSGTETGTTA
ncbi:hypothetical protein D477_011806 [Arthrobacter crystallopoietes BAB-32]|uniref:Uncharacterized protein n=1 Tax=Arthrobacter crystallopoietes BAB-32 TaxID=1246476 RepID=N1V1S3_9MICC|nr:hypothetical protein [Arthrobacter crystallopoietes]EMY34027.1 hypothetical protein D477_011806 [Arthrobacter crystallopoietes BAB-32]